MKDKDQRQTGDSTKKVPQQDQSAKRGGQQGGERTGGKDHEQSRQTDKGKGR